MIADTSPPSGASGLFSVIGSALPILTTALLVASLAYDYTFLWALGLSFDSIPSSLTEHVRSAIVWAPKLAIAGLLYAGLEMFLRRTEGGMSEEELIARSADPQFTRKFRRSGDKAMQVSALLVAIVGPFFSTDDSWVFITFLVLWGALAISVVRQPRLSVLFPSTASRFLLIAPIMLSMVGMYGYQSGVKLLTPKEATWQLTIKKEEGTEVLRLSGIRRFSAFAIAVSEEKAVSIIPNESILIASTLKPHQPLEMNACRWLGVMCLNRAAPSEKSLSNVSIEPAAPGKPASGTHVKR